MNQPNNGVWTDKFAANSTQDLEDGLAYVLKLQAERVQKLVDSEPPDNEKLAMEHEKRIDKNLDKVFKNGQSLLLTRKPRPSVHQAALTPSQRMDELPDRPTGPLIAEALEEMEQVALTNNLEFDRNRITDEQIWDWLAARGMVKPQPREQRAIEQAF